MYHRFHISSPPSFSALVLHRSGSRAWKSQNQIIQLVRRIAIRFNATVNHSDLFGYDLPKQVALFSQSDVVIAAHGAALTNVMFMRPHTAVVECFPPYFYELTFETICGLEQVLYIINKGLPVIAMTDANHAILLTGYSMTDITYIDPDTASQNTVSIEQMSAMIAGSGNTFIGYMK